MLRCPVVIKIGAMNMDKQAGSLKGVWHGAKVFGEKILKSRPIKNIQGSVENAAAIGGAKGAIKGGWSGLKSAIGAGTRSSGSFDTRPLAAALTVTGLAGAHAYGSKGRYAYKARKVESNDILKKEKYLANMGRTRYLDRVKSRKDKKK